MAGFSVKASWRGPFGLSFDRYVDSFVDHGSCRQCRPECALNKAVRAVERGLILLGAHDCGHGRGVGAKQDTNYCRHEGHEVGVARFG